MQQANFKVVLDACVLANARVCDLYLRLAEGPRLYLPRWSSEILDEVRRTQTTKLKKPYSAELADYWREEVIGTFPEALIEGYEHLVPLMANHAKDRHVLAAAVREQASLIVTFNLKDFPPEACEPWKVCVEHPEEYLLTLYSLSPAVVVARLADMAKNQQTDIESTLLHLGKSVPRFAQHVLAEIRAR